jgi:hypothetical protein
MYPDVLLGMFPVAQGFTGKHRRWSIAFDDCEKITREAPKTLIGCEQLHLRRVPRLRSRVFPHLCCKTHLNSYLTSGTYAVHRDPDVLLRQ